jgi:hypothetical protein
MVIDPSGRIANRISIWRRNECESTALRVKPQIGIHFEPLWVLGIVHSVRTAAPKEEFKSPSERSFNGRPFQLIDINSLQAEKPCVDR